MDPLLGAPDDYEARYASSTSSKLEDRLNGLDSEPSQTSPSRSGRSTNMSKSPMTKGTLKRNSRAMQAGNSLTPLKSFNAYRSSW